MREDKDSVVEIDPKGLAHPLGHTAALRLQSRAGRYNVLPGPPHVLFLRRANGTEEEDRACRLSGEIRGPGSLCDVVGFIGHGGWRGELLVFDPHASRSIFFDQGHVIAAQSTVVAERLGQILFRYGALSSEQVSACDDAMADSSMRFGEVAVRLGFISREHLFTLSSRQIEEIFYGLLLVSEGTFYFLDSYDDSALSVRQKLSVAQLIREGVRRMHETRFFRTRIPSDRHVPLPTAGMPRPESDPLGIHEFIDGQRSVKDLCRKLNQSEFEISRALFQLVQTGHIVVKPPRLTPFESTEVFNQAVALVLRELDAMDEGDPVRRQLAEFASTAPVYAILFDGAGPADDGTLDPARVAANSNRLPESEAQEIVARSLYDCASYALFLARPHLHRASDAQVDRDEEESRRRRLSQRVSTMLEPIAPSPSSPPGDAAPPAERMGKK